MKALAIDIGASSGRFIVIEFKEGKFHLTETHRFPNGMKEIDGHLRWDMEHLFTEIHLGLIKTLKEYSDISSIGVDTWGVDYGRLDEKGRLVDNPIGYRDRRNAKAANELLSQTPYAEIYSHSGIQYLPFNTIFPLYDDLKKKEVMDSFLLIPDLINDYLCGEKRMELTNVSTTSLYNPVTRKIDPELMKKIGLKESQLSPLVYPSTKIGTLRQTFIDEGLYPVDIVSVGSHDTASAVASVLLDEHTAYLSSGTWSLLGVENKEPVISEESYRANFTNEIGLDHTVRFLKNLMGLFIVQELKKDYEKEILGLSFQYMQDEASKVLDNRIYIDVNAPEFQEPGEMKNKYLNYLKKTGQYKDDLTIGEVTRSVYESMAFGYIASFHQLERLLGRELTKITVIGGGIKAHVLNQCIADSLGVYVDTDEQEATAIGNGLAQFLYLGVFSSLTEAREALRASTKKDIYEPVNHQLYQKKYQDYLEKIGGKHHE